MKTPDTSEGLSTKVTSLLIFIFLSIIVPLIIGLSFTKTFTSATDVVQNSGTTLNELEKNIQRLKGLQTQFGSLADFLRFDHKIGNEIISNFSTDNDYINNALPNSTGLTDVHDCFPKIANSLPVEKLQEQINLLKQALSEDCFKKVLGVNDKFVKTYVKNELGPSFSVYPDKVSQWIVYIFAFTFWNALLLLFLSVYKNLIDIVKKWFTEQD